MIATCPNCATRFAVSEANLGAAGRKVKCSRCGQVWLQRRDGSTASAPAAPMLSPVSPGEPAASTPAGEQAEAVAGIPDNGAHDDLDLRPAPARAQGRGGRVAALFVVLVLVLGALGVGTIAWRGGGVATLPGASALMQLLRLDGHGPENSAAVASAVPTAMDGLGFENVKTSRHVDGDVQILVIAGDVVNNASAPRTVPPLRGALLGSDNRELQHWTFSAKTEILGAGQRAGFETTLRAPAADATDVKVTFTPPGG